MATKINIFRFITLCFMLVISATGFSAVLSYGNSNELIRTNTDTLVYELDEVVVTAFNRSQQIVELPGSLTHLGSLLMEREKSSYNIFPVLNYAPGIFAHSGATNTSRITIRGIGARVPYATGKIRAYFDNIPLTNTSGVTFIEDIDPAVIEQMEIIKGPATSVYGAGLGGTIAITARRPTGRKTGVQNTSQFGSFGMFRNSLMADLVFDDFASSVVYSHSRSEGYRENDEFRRDAITSVNQWQRSEQTLYTALFAFSDLKSHIPSSVDSITYADNPRAAAQNWLRTRGYEDSQRFLGGVTAAHNFAGGLSADVSVFTIWHDEKEMRPFDVFYEERFTLGSRFKVTRIWDVGAGSVNLTSGGEAFGERYFYRNYQNIDGEGEQGDQISDNREDVGTFNLFLQSDASVNRWNFSAGVNLNYTGIQYSDLFDESLNNLSGNYNYGIIVSPRLSAGYLYYERNNIFLTLSHGFSPPSLSETLTPEGQINPDIRPEKSWNLELGLRGSVQQGRFFYDLNLYAMRVQDLLVAERVGEDAWVGRNAGESLHRGLEFELHWIFLRDFALQGFVISELSLRSNYSLNHFRFTDFVDQEVDYSGSRIPGVPDQVFFSGLYAELASGLYAMGSYRFVDRMAMNDANTRFTGSYDLIDMTIGLKQTFLSSWNIDLFLRVNNVLDQKYASMILVNAPSFGSSQPRYYYPGLPRNFVAGLKMAL